MLCDILLAEKEKVLKTYFKLGKDGPLDSFPFKEKKKLIVLDHIVKRFDLGKTYTESEVNMILSEIFHDVFLLRRSLIDYEFMERTSNGSAYWVSLDYRSSSSQLK
ncbi:MAG: hypothetical protein AWM53_01108 [Candidatus Dichloromethanomonas elyunquensis]|nr:MAG: hypothetical protein AWM53_01108 [Candidatus Dichloromethanomonas elyunquensis]